MPIKTLSRSSRPLERSSLLPREAPRVAALRRVRSWIEDGTFAPGQPLPSERALSEQLGVARLTVSQALSTLAEEGWIRSNGGKLRIVNGKPELSQKTAKKASLLEHSIAVLTGYSEAPQHKQSGWLEYITTGATGAIREAGWHSLLLHPARVGGSEVSRLLGDPPAGLIVTDLPIENDPLRKVLFRLQNEGVRVVVYGDWPAYADFDRVTSDHEAGAYALTRHLIGQGRTRILQTTIAPTDGYWYAPRRAGYERAMREAGLEPLPSLELPSFPKGNEDAFRGGVRTLAGYLIEHFNGAAPIDAILASTDADVFGLSAACRLFNRELGRDVLLCGYDNYWAEWPARQFESCVPTATVDKNNRLIGETMVGLLLERLEGRLSEDAQKRVVEPQLVVPAL